MLKVKPRFKVIFYINFYICAAFEWRFNGNRFTFEKFSKIETRKRKIGGMEIRFSKAQLREMNFWNKYELFRKICNKLREDAEFYQITSIDLDVESSTLVNVKLLIN